MVGHSHFTVTCLDCGRWAEVNMNELIEDGHGDVPLIPAEIRLREMREPFHGIPSVRNASVRTEIKSRQ
jgi:hypothetical protein